MPIRFHRSCFALLWAAALVVPIRAAVADSPPPAPAWVERSNQNAQVLLEVMGRFTPEITTYFGAGNDDQVTDLAPGYLTRQNAALAEAITELQRRLANETDHAIRQDLVILIEAAQRQAKGNDLLQKHALPYFSISQLVFQGLQPLLDEQVPPAQRASAVTRLRRYAGLEKGHQPIAVLAEARTREKLADSGLMRPYQGEVERDLATSPQLIDGVGQLLAKYKPPGWEKPYAALKKQVAAYNAFVRREVLPVARTDFRQPPELYAYALEMTGVDMPVEELLGRAKVSFEETRAAMQALAPLVARERGWKLTDYRDVIRELKKNQLSGDAIVRHYEARIGEIEKIIQREKIATLPTRPMQFELASAAETAAIPAPHVRPPRLIGNTGERGTFVLPLSMPSGGGEKTFDDFNYEAASWTLTAHEGRPGHEMQFSSVIERGVSLARALFAFNSVNVEGWGLYAEAELMPYEPLDGQLVTLQNRLMRAARAMLDPGLQLGRVTREEAYRMLHQEVGLSDAMTTQEVDRYTFLAPGQATAYFTGYSRLLEIRADAERALGARFDRRQFNDFVLGQGLLPPALLRQAVEEEFITKAGESTAK